MHTVRGARKMIEKQSPEVWDILEEVTKGHPVLLNRAPTLHRSPSRPLSRCSLKATRSVSIRWSVLPTTLTSTVTKWRFTCHCRLEAVMEAKTLMMATHNIFSPSSGKPILTPSQDIVLGSYFLTVEPRSSPRRASVCRC